MNPGKRKALGRGLAALIPDAGVRPAAATAVPSAATDPVDGAAVVIANGGAPGAPARPRDGLAILPIEDVHPSSLQPRRTFNEDRLQELAESIRTQGIIEPLVVRARKAGGYALIAGERRWRAAQKAGLREVPAIIKDVAETRAFEMALVENLQREDLNPIEEAEGYQRLISEFGYTQEMLAARVGKDRSTVANSLRLLRLPDRVRAMVIDGRLSMGHARALLGLDSGVGIEQLARQAASRNLSVRAVEALVRKSRQAPPPGDPRPAPEGPPRPSPAARDLSERLARGLGTRVKVVESGPGTGHLEIYYHSLDELDRLLGRLLPS